MCERFDLIPPHGIESVEKVLQHRLTKHEVNKWKYGMSWSKILSSLKKHLLEFEKGNDFDENGLLNIAYVAESALILAEYYDIYPHGDDRVVGIVDRPIIALDIDDVVLDFKSAFEKRFGKLNEYWDGSYEISDDLNKIKNDKEFWTNLPVLNKPTFEPAMYITSRSIPVEWTKENLQKMGLPCAPVYCVPWNESKVAIMKEHNVSVLIDDKPDNYKDAVNNGIFCYLMDSPHNKWFRVPEHRRITNLDLKF